MEEQWERMGRKRVTQGFPFQPFVTHNSFYSLDWDWDGPEDETTGRNYSLERIWTQGTKTCTSFLSYVVDLTLIPLIPFIRLSNTCIHFRKMHDKNRHAITFQL